MKTTEFIFLLLGCCLFTGACNGQDTQPAQQAASARIGGGCEDCDVMYIGMPEIPSWTDTSSGWQEPGQKLLLTGTIFEPDGKTPASGIILYYWQTDVNGYYSPKPGMDARTGRHGHIRGWVKTGADGRYAIYTIRPAPYPNDVSPAHIHLLIKEPALEHEYYTDDVVFDDDKLLIPYLKKYPANNRGGSGIVRVLLRDSVQVAEHSIVLGLNIPGHPGMKAGAETGLSIGEDQPSFIPYHAYGPDKGSRACPVCKYGRFHGILYFAGNGSDAGEISRWMRFLEKESETRQQFLKTYLVYGKATERSAQTADGFLRSLGEQLNIRYSALTWVPSFSDRETEAYLNRIDQSVKNVFIIYKHRRIVDKFINMDPTPENFHLIANTLEQTKGEFFDLKAMH